MAEKITYSISAQVSNGPKISESKIISIEGYDKTQVSVADLATDFEVNIQPAGAGLAQFLSITSSAYDSTITYKVNSAASTDVLPLDGPHLLIGTGAVSLLDEEPTALFFSNSSGADVTIDILVGRDATP